MDTFYVGNLKKIFLKPSKIPEEKEYYCVGDVPSNGIAIYDQGYFIPTKAWRSIIGEMNNETNRLKDELTKNEANNEIKYDKLKRKYDLLLDKIGSYEDNGDSSGILL